MPFFGSLIATQGYAAIFNGRKSLKMEEGQNHIFVFPSRKSPWKGFFNILL
jgi:hypothetical protein